MGSRPFGIAYLIVFTGLLSACGQNGPGVEGRTIPTAAALDGRSFRDRLSQGPYRASDTGYEAAGAFELRAQVNPPKATRADLKMLSRAESAVPFTPTYVLRGTQVDDGAFRLKPAPIEVDVPAITSEPLEYGELSESFVREVARRGSLPLPLLSDGRQVLRAKSVSIRDGKGGEREAGELLDASKGLVPTILSGEAIRRKRSDEKVVIAFETLLIEDGRRSSPVRPWLEGKRPSGDKPLVGGGPLTHPGQNAHLKETVDRALAIYREKFATEAISMIDFVERFRLADCKMVALATVQKPSTVPGKASYRAFVVSGNRVERFDTVDLLTSNHAWNAAIDGRRAVTLALADFTPESRRPLEYAYDGSTLKWVTERLRAAASRDEFRVVADGAVVRRNETVPARLRDDAKGIDAELGRLTRERVEALLPSTEWAWDGMPPAGLLTDGGATFVRKHRANGERVVVTVEPVLHWGKKGEALYERVGDAGLWELATERMPQGPSFAMNWSGATTFERFGAEVTHLEKSASSHSKEFYWRMEVLFYATK